MDGKTLSISTKSCITPTISNCVAYDDDSKCETCNTGTTPSVSKQACVTPTTNCIAYNNDGKCASCDTKFQITVSQSSCLTEIVNCEIRNDNGTCYKCKNGWGRYDNIDPNAGQTFLACKKIEDGVFLRSGSDDGLGIVDNCPRQCGACSSKRNCTKCKIRIL